VTNNSAQFSSVIYHPFTGSTPVRSVTWTAEQHR